MNKFVKKILAKYVKYVEIIGYAFVILFIAGLIALSKIKAEDEYVNLKGKYEIPSFFIQFNKRHFIVDILSDTNSYVSENSPLLEVTADEKFIADQIILHNLEQQVTEAQNAANSKLANKIASIIFEIEAKDYRDLKISTVRTPIAGDFFLMNSGIDLLDSNKIIGGVFDFSESFIKVTELSTDKRIRRKLTPGQSGTATFKIGTTEQISIPVTIEKMDENEAIVKLNEILIEDKFKIAYFIASTETDKPITVNVSILVGWKSWMNLIWR